jgi:hypothetical protein
MLMSTPPFTAIAAEKVTGNPNENSATASTETCGPKYHNRSITAIRSVYVNLDVHQQAVEYWSSDSPNVWQLTCDTVASGSRIWRPCR